MLITISVAAWSVGQVSPHEENDSDGHALNFQQSWSVYKWYSSVFIELAYQFQLDRSVIKRPLYREMLHKRD
jgi:hypothetical protein